MVEIPPEMIAFAILDQRCAKVVHSTLFRSFSSSKRSEFVHLLALAGSFENLPFWAHKVILDSEAQTKGSVAYDPSQPRDDNGQRIDTCGVAPGMTATKVPEILAPAQEPEHKKFVSRKEIYAKHEATLDKLRDTDPAAHKEEWNIYMAEEQQWTQDIQKSLALGEISESEANKLDWHSCGNIQNTGKAVKFVGIPGNEMTNEEFAALDKRMAEREIKQMDEDDTSIIAACKRGISRRKASVAAAKEEQQVNMIDSAIKVALKAHLEQKKKGTDSPYIVHPISVAIILSRAGCSDEVIAAGILHDTIEDTKITLQDIQEIFGEKVAEIVKGCSEPDKSLPWKERKMHTIEFLKTAPLEVRLVACADKLHNIRSLARDYEIIGDKVWERFNEKRKEEQEWYYRGIVDSLCTKADSKDVKLFKLLKREVENFFDLINRI